MDNCDLIKKQNLQKDIKQLKKLILETQNERVGQFLADKVACLKSQLEFIVDNSVKLIKTVPLVEVQNKKQYTTLTKFSWQQVQGKKLVKILLNLEGIKKECRPEQIQLDFTERAFVAKIHDYKQKNYIFGITKLYSDIVPSKSSFQLRENYLIIKLHKKVEAEWMDIHFKKDIFATKKQEENKMKEMNQQQKLLDMVKKIYDDGDPEFQKVIKQAYATVNDERRKKSK